MNKLTIAFFVLSISAVVLGSPDGTYSDRYDNFDIDLVLSSERMLKNYVNCMMDTGPCTAEGKDLKVVIPEVVATSCGKCTKAQRGIMRKIIKHLQANRPDYWKMLMNKYDPESKYLDNVTNFTNAEY